MISFEEANHLVSVSSRYPHMVLVSSLMAQTARQLEADTDAWRLVGLLHDLDYDETKTDRSQHGVLAAQMLEGKLPSDCLDAIKRHDHRTGLKPETDLDFALILCDSVSIILEQSNRKPPVKYDDFMVMLDYVSAEKPWLRKLVLENPVLEKIDLGLLLHSQ